MKICSICQEKYTGFGNNAEPINSGRCCDDCNSEVVIPQRIVDMYRRVAKDEKVSN